MAESKYSAVPAALRERAQWLLWRLEDKPGAKKPAKMPYYASGRRRTGVQGSDEDRAALVTFDEAVRRADEIAASGIGFAFLPGDGLIGIDLDKMVDAETGEIAPRAQAIIEACASYTEWSPSGNGFHIYVLGETGTAKDNGIGVEMFCGRQFFTVTGRAFSGTVPDVRPIDAVVLRRLHATIAKAKEGFPEAAPPSAPAVPAQAPMSERDKVDSALSALDPGMGYDDWLRVGMALHAGLGDEGFAVWDAWSARAAKYPGAKDLQSHWKSFKPGAVKLATLFHLAKDAGWKPRRAGRPKKSPTPSEKGGASTQPTGGEGAQAGEARPKPKRAKEDKPIDWERYNALKDDFVLIYGTDTVFDLRCRLILKVNALRLAFGSEYVKMWLNSPMRKMIRTEQLVFDPSCRCEKPEINLFDGLPAPSKPGDFGPIMELLYHLCEESAQSEQGVEAVVQWVLKWLALPLQRLGTKMRSALVFHGPQGAGKNLFFEIIAAIYGRYALVVGQAQLESDFNDWASQRLFLIGDEVVARQEMFHQKNKLKAFITGETIQINTKMMPLRTEANHINVVFLSNEHQPLALEPGDRRFLVVYTPARRHDDLYLRVAACLKNGGAAAFHHYLRTLDLEGFTEFDIPLMTQAKKDLIELGLKPAERFAREWIAGYLPLPLQVCSAEQLYRAFRRWAQNTGERFFPIQDQFTKQVKKTFDLIAHTKPEAGELMRFKVCATVDEHNGRKSKRMWIPAGCAPPDGVSETSWVSDCEGGFEQVLREFCGGRDAQAG